MDNFIYNMAQSIATAFGSDPLVVYLMSMLPIVEVRGGIPVGLQLGMSPASSFGYSILASLTVTPIILFLLKAVIKWMCKSKIFGNFGKALDGYFYDKAQKIEEGKVVQNRKNLFLKYLALYLFVAAPLPLTGYWTGSAVAVFMNLNPFISFFVIALGNMTAGGLILAMSLLLGDNAYIITLIFIIFIPIVLIVLTYKLIKKKKENIASVSKELDNKFNSDKTNEQVPQENIVVDDAKKEDCSCDEVIVTTVETSQDSVDGMVEQSNDKVD